MRTIAYPQKEIPVIAETDVLVVGSGPAGIAAAVASARTGAETMLMDRYGCFGGALSVGQVESYNWYFNQNTYTAGGLATEIESRMIQRGGTQRDDRGTGNFLNAEIYKLMLDEWVEEEHIRPLLHAVAVDAVVKDGCVCGVVIESKSGRAAILAKQVVDATGDGDVAVQAGAGFDLGDENHAGLLPVTMVFGVSGVDTQKFREYVKATPESVDPYLHGLKGPFLRAQRNGDWPYSREGGAWKTLSPNGDFTSMNITREFNINGVDVMDLTRAEMDGRKQAMQAIRVLKKYAGEMGFANCWLRSFAGQIGVRETRRIRGEYSITRKDIVSHACFPDSVGVFTTFIDGEYISRDDAHFQLPFRMLLPQGLENLAVAGRCVSCASDAMQTVRMMVCCTATGQAAGTACAMAAQKGCSLRQLDLAQLQSRLREDGVRLE